MVNLLIRTALTAGLAHWAYRKGRQVGEDGFDVAADTAAEIGYTDGYRDGRNDGIDEMMSFGRHQQQIALDEL